MNAQVVAAEIGPLRIFNDAGVFTAADVHVARRVAALSGADIGDDELIAIALAVRAVRTGSTCVPLATIGEITPELESAEDPAADTVLPWPDPDRLVATLQASPLVTGCPSGPLRPLALMTSDEGPLLYLRKYFRQEQAIRAILEQRGASRPTIDPAALEQAIDRVFGPLVPGSDYDRQRAAAALAATSWTTVLAGGPGTGKTYTVARLLAVMEQLLGADVRIGLCAPTGRAAAQMQASINDYRATSQHLSTVPVATTVHRLLGWRPDGSFGRGAGNRLPYDVVVVDETSMLAVTMMSRLLESLREDTRLILVGDPHQLASVDAGAVLADLVDRDGTGTELPSAFVQVARPQGHFTEAEERRLAGGVITLTRGHRYGGQISEVAEAIRAGDADRVVDLITGPAAGAFESRQVSLLAPDAVEPVRRDVLRWAAQLQNAARAGQAGEALEALVSHRVLCAHRDGRHGVSGWSRQIIDWITEAGGAVPRAGWYSGEPVLVNANDAAHQVFNGDSGVVITDTGGSSGDGLAVVFARGDEIKTLHPSQLSDASPVYAMTIHRSQGSQFGAVTVVLPELDAQLLTKELLYTAVTRARHTVQIVGTEEALRAAVGRSVQRASGLGSSVREL
ncbi:exodeoxyribonuclease V alpha chain [Gordonia hirsuta DSM 44140 = NBRC 16056]|uniref:RecBCD enzyme subunit RecD n=1 Tax=Gordonia hirsuta DSM 44140 = NBRC 16056 TaxID=1121927 RepID=L7L4K7_9ACTN|nr:exodeoxyribonuclease V subunit alpha [Gordonia hirsuta]GAC56065.1 exodeoxyribonuclease V alpha chain [Gordonia hirsuta DSM 44140 = NBRC 16056]